MSRTEERDARPFVSPERARSLFTVRAAISFARFVERPCFFSESLMCSYCRSRLLLHADCGISNPPKLDDGHLYAHFRRALFQRRILDVVLVRILLRQVIDDVETLAVRVVDLDEG